jgi:excisionase family DNA binding protein
VYVDHLARLSNSEAFEPRFGRSVSLDQAAGLLRVSRRTVYNWIRAGRLRTIRTLGGKSQRVLLASLNEVAGEQSGQARIPAPQSCASFELS